MTIASDSQQIRKRLVSLGFEDSDFDRINADVSLVALGECMKMALSRLPKEKSEAFEKMNDQQKAKFLGDEKLLQLLTPKEMDKIARSVWADYFEYMKQAK